MCHIDLLATPHGAVLLLDSRFKSTIAEKNIKEKLLDNQKMKKNSQLDNYDFRKS